MLTKELSAQWHPDNDRTSDDVSPGSSYRAKWRCGRDPRHVWVASVRKRARSSTGCPVCLWRTVIPGINDLATTHPEVAAQWDESNDIGPHEVYAGSHGVYTFRCELGHVTRAEVRSRALRGCCCGVCAGRIIVSGFNDMATLRPDLAAQWHPDN